MDLGRIDCKKKIYINKRKKVYCEQMTPSFMGKKLLMFLDSIRL